MSSQNKTGSRIILLAVAAAACGAATGAVVLVLGHSGQESQGPLAIECKADPRLIADNNGFKKSLDETPKLLF